MKTISEKCVDLDSVDSFCDCIAGEEPLDSPAHSFCGWAKNNKGVTAEDLAELKIALMDREEDDACCDC